MTPSANRRQFLSRTALATASLFCSRMAASGEKRQPRILLRSSWQVVNIGDVAHTPGVLALLEKQIPEAEVILWASGDISPAVIEMETRRFPRLKIVKGSINAEGRGSTPELHAALKWCDFLLHGSGPSLVAHRDVAAFVKTCEKPFGVYGITYSGMSPSGVELLSRAQFAFFRDSVSLRRAKSDGVTCPIMEFGPDGAFAVDVHDDAAAEKFLNAHDLQTGKFVCCIPRLRYTPYWLIKPGRQLDAKKQARNEEMRDHDHAPLREAICRVARETDLKILICPEDMTQMAVGKENLVDRLPADVLKKVVWRQNFWLTDEALSTYRRSAGLFGLEMHSPIMCIGNGIPAIVGRFAEQTSKGFMWQDIGLQDWLFDLDLTADVARYAPTVLNMIQDPNSAKVKVKQAQSLVQSRQIATMQVLRDSLASIS